MNTLDWVVGTSFMTAGILWITHIYRASLTFEPLGRNEIIKRLQDKFNKDNPESPRRVAYNQIYGKGGKL